MRSPGVPRDKARWLVRTLSNSGPFGVERTYVFPEIAVEMRKRRCDAASVVNEVAVRGIENFAHSPNTGFNSRHSMSSNDEHSVETGSLPGQTTRGAACK